MEHTVWTNERLDDLAESMRNGFARNDKDIRELRAEMALQRRETRAEFSDVRREMREGFTEVRGEIAALRQLGVRIGGGLMVGFASVIATILLQAPA